MAARLKPETIASDLRVPGRKMLFWPRFGRSLGARGRDPRDGAAVASSRTR